VDHLEDLDDDDLAARYAYPAAPDRPVVRANFVATVDGSATGPDGRSGSINTDADHRVFGLLRGLADVVLAGAGTVRAEGYRAIRTQARWRAVREGLGLAAHPALAVVSGGLDLPDELLDAPPGSGPVVVLTSERAGAAAVARVRSRVGHDGVLVCGEESVDVQTALDRLSDRGWNRVLLEGGPGLMNAVSGSGLLDELCLTITPVLVGGDGPRMATGPWLRQPVRLVHLLESEGTLLTRWARA
jgi:riboflavin biosynthesis pyrimidine reductase